MNRNADKIIEWFKELLSIENVKFVYDNDNKSCDGFDSYEFDIYVLTRKTLYYDKTNNIISTHSPYGSHWENRKDVLKIKSTENFRWVIKGEEFLSNTTPCYVTVEDYNGNKLVSKCFNEGNLIMANKFLYDLI